MTLLQFVLLDEGEYVIGRDRWRMFGVDAMRGNCATRLNRPPASHRKSAPTAEMRSGYGEINIHPSPDGLFYNFYCFCGNINYCLALFGLALNIQRNTPHDD